MSCSAVRNSPYSRVLNTPLSAYGCVWFTIMLLVTMRLSRTAHCRGFGDGLPSYLSEDALFTALLLWILVGLVSVVYFVYAEWRIGAICPLCTVVHIIIIAQALLLRRSYAERLRRNPKAHIVLEVSQLFRAAAQWILGSAALTALALLVFNVFIDLNSKGWSLAA